MNENKNLILKVLVGSRAHGLHTEESDYDYRGVYVVPTQQILSLGYKYKGSHWLEGDKEDQTAWEIGHFLTMAMNCNPTILEVFKAPLAEDKTFTQITADLTHPAGNFLRENNFGEQLLKLFPYVWNPKDAFNAFVGYGLNQRKKMLDNHLDRWEKYAVAYLRTLWNLDDLLRTKDFSLEIRDKNFKSVLKDVKAGGFTVGDIINMTNEMTKTAETSLAKCQHTPDPDKVNNFLLKIRKEFWN